jgi:hypothetical protein
MELTRDRSRSGDARIWRYFAGGALVVASAVVAVVIAAVTTPLDGPTQTDAAGSLPGPP